MVNKIEAYPCHFPPTSLVSGLQMSQKKGSFDDLSAFSPVDGSGTGREKDGEEMFSVASETLSLTLEEIETIMQQNEQVLELQVDDDLRDEEEALTLKSVISSSNIDSSKSTSEAVLPSNPDTPIVESQTSLQSNKRGYDSNSSLSLLGPPLSTSPITEMADSSNPILPKAGETRIDYLLRVPELMRQAINIGSETMIAAIVNEACLPECMLKTTALQTGATGRQNITKMYCSLLSIIPDMVILIKPASLSVRVITSKVNYYGTQVFRDIQNEHLYDYLKYGSDKAGKYTNVRALAFQLEQERKQIIFRAKSFLHLILNMERTHVIKWICANRVLTIAEGPDMVSLKKKNA